MSDDYTFLMIGLLIGFGLYAAVLIVAALGWLTDRYWYGDDGW